MPPSKGVVENKWSQTHAAARKDTIVKKNLLLVEDEPGIRKLILMYLRDENFNVLEAEDGEEALRLFKAYKIDFVILDIMLPQLDGLRVCEYIRSSSDVPIIMLTAKTQEEDKLRGFEYGADEYVTKPFSPKVLVARIKALLKRVEGKVSKGTSFFSVEGLTLNYITGKLTVDNLDVILTHKEFDLLVYLIQNRGIILSKHSILNSVWGYDYYGDPRTVDTHIKRLREKLGKRSAYIVTSRGRGYSFEVQHENS